MLYVIGIDPGMKGGIAVLCEHGDVVDVSLMPSTMSDLLDYLSEYGVGGRYMCDGARVVCYLEDVGHGMPNQSSRATAVFARHCGHLEMALLSLGIKVVTVTPSKWMKEYQLGKSSDYGKTEWKNRLKAKCQQLFPMLGKKVTLSTCDALLLSEYGRRKEIGGI